MLINKRSILRNIVCWLCAAALSYLLLRHRAPPPPPPCPSCMRDVGWVDKIVSVLWHRAYIPPVGTSPINELADIPTKFRQKNWGAQDGSGGSCVHASVITLLRWQGQFSTALWWRQQYEGGENWGPLVQKLEAAGVQWAGTCYADDAFLEWACRNRLGAVIEFSNSPIRHALVIVDLTPTHAVILDNNSPLRYKVYTRADFMQVWRGRSFACAFTIVGTPPPPWPK